MSTKEWWGPKGREIKRPRWWSTKPRDWDYAGLLADRQSGLTLRQLGEKHGVSYERIRQLLKKAQMARRADEMLGVVVKKQFPPCEVS